MLIHKALLKYDYSSFKLEILEYCIKDNLLSKEQDYLDTLKPEYNILKIAGSSLGYKHSEGTRAKMSSSHKGLSAGHLNPMFGKSRPRPVGAGKPYTQIEVIDTKNGVTTRYNSISAAALALNIAQSTISIYFARNQKLYKNQYVFKKL